jgi:hypothetical protein
MATIEQRVEQVFLLFDYRFYIMLVLSESTRLFFSAGNRYLLMIWLRMGSSARISRKIKQIKISIMIVSSQSFVYVGCLSAQRSWSSIILKIKSIKTKMMSRKSKKCWLNMKKVVLFSSRNLKNWPYLNFLVLLTYSSIKYTNLTKLINLQLCKDWKSIGTWSNKNLCKKLNWMEGATYFYNVTDGSIIDSIQLQRELHM